MNSKIFNFVFYAIFALAFAITVGLLSFNAYVAYKVVDTVENAESIPAVIGSFIGEVEKSYNSSKK